MAVLYLKNILPKLYNGSYLRSRFTEKNKTSNYKKKYINNLYKKFLSTYTHCYIPHAAESCKRSHKNHFKDDKTQHLSPATICSTPKPLTFTSRESAFLIIFIIYMKVCVCVYYLR